MEIDELIDGILESYEKEGGINRSESGNLPNRENVIFILHDLECLVFPGFQLHERIASSSLRYLTGMRVNRIADMLTAEIEKVIAGAKESKVKMTPRALSLSLIAEIAEIRRKIMRDAACAFREDPAATGVEEVILSYPCIEAILVYRIAHFLYEKGIPIIPRMMSEYVHGKTGIDINAGAVIGEDFFIDHGTGVVIGETAVIGRGVKIYQGVTLGALSVAKEDAKKKRHPTIEDDVTIYAGATILGSRTVIGEGSVIGGNVWVVRSVPPHSLVTRER